MSSLTIPIILAMQRKSLKKGVFFVQNCIFKCVYHKLHKYEVSTSIHAIFDLVFRNSYFFIVISNTCGPKMQFPANSQNSISKNSIFVNLRSFFSTYKNFPEQEWLIPVSKFKEEFLTKQLSSLAGLRKAIQFLAKVPILAIFDYLGPPSKSTFSTYRQNIE